MSLDAGNDPNRRSKIEDEHEREDDSEANYALGPNGSSNRSDPPIHRAETLPLEIPSLSSSRFFGAYLVYQRVMGGIE